MKQWTNTDLHEYMEMQGISCLDWSSADWEEFYSWFADRDTQAPKLEPDTASNEKSVNQPHSIKTKWNAKYFREAEMLYARGKIDNNWRDPSHRANAHDLCVRLLDKIREAWGSPIKITSGYRVPELNAMVGGSSTSDHIYGRAADIYPTNGNVRGLAKLIDVLKAKGSIEYDQLIPSEGFIHISYRADKNRNQKLKRTKDGRYVLVS